LRRRRSAGLSLRGFGLGFVPLRPPAAAAAAAAPWRTGARRRASRQMKYEIPPNTTTAPIAIPIAALPLRPLEPADGVVDTTGAVVVVDGICEGDSGTPGDNGFPFWPGGEGEIGALLAGVLFADVLVEAD
jgi:hypothetical protein